MKIENGNTSPDLEKCSVDDFQKILGKYSIDRSTYEDKCSKNF
jgi:hypothetical protein